MSAELAPLPATATGGDAETGAAAASLDLPPEPEIGRGFLKPVPETTVTERAAGGAAVGAIVTAVAAMIVEAGSAVVVVAGILSIVVGPYCYYQQTRLTDIRTLQETQRVLQREVDQFAASNHRLVANIDDMTESVDRLQEIEQALEIIGSRQGVTVQQFAQQVADHQKLLQQMRGNLQANVLQNLLSVILRSDADKDFTMDDDEMEALIRRLQNISGVTVHADKFRAAIAGQSINAVMEIVKNLLRPNVPAEERIFDIAGPNSSNST